MPFAHLPVGTYPCRAGASLGHLAYFSRSVPLSEALLVLGRLEEELQALAEAGITSEVIPGVTAALAAAAASARPLTRRGNGRSVSLTTRLLLSSVVFGWSPAAARLEIVNMAQMHQASARFAVALMGLPPTSVEAHLRSDHGQNNLLNHDKLGKFT